MKCEESVSSILYLGGVSSYVSLRVRCVAISGFGEVWDSELMLCGVDGMLVLL